VLCSLRPFSFLTSSWQSGPPSHSVVLFSSEIISQPRTPRASSLREEKAQETACGGSSPPFSPFWVEDNQRVHLRTRFLPFLLFFSGHSDNPCHADHGQGELSAHPPLPFFFRRERVEVALSALLFSSFFPSSWGGDPRPRRRRGAFFPPLFCSRERRRGEEAEKVPLSPFLLFFFFSFSREIVAIIESSSLLLSFFLFLPPFSRSGSEEAIAHPSGSFSPFS